MQESGYMYKVEVSGRSIRLQVSGCSGISETKFCILRPSPRLEFSESQFRDRVRDLNFLGLSFETESETEVFKVSISRPSPRL